MLAAPGSLWLRVVLLTAGVVLQAAATAAYIGAQLGRGPRDGLMTGLARRTGRSLRLVRTLMELTVVAIGLLLGGVAGHRHDHLRARDRPAQPGAAAILPGAGLRRLSPAEPRSTSVGVRPRTASVSTVSRLILFFSDFGPKGDDALIPFGWDMVVVAAWSLVIYDWAMEVALSTEKIQEMIGEVEVPDEDMQVPTH